MTVLYPNQCYNEVCYKVTELYEVSGITGSEVEEKISIWPNIIVAIYIPEEPHEAFEEVIAHRLQGHTLRVDDEVTSPSNRRVNHLSNNLPHHVNDVHLPDYEDEEEDLHGYMNMPASQKSVRVEGKRWA